MEIEQREFSSVSSSQSTRRVVDSAVPAMSLCRSCRIPFLPRIPIIYPSFVNYSFLIHFSLPFSLYFSFLSPFFFFFFFLALFKVERSFRCTPDAAIRPSSLSFVHYPSRTLLRDRVRPFSQRLFYRTVRLEHLENPCPPIDG